LVLCFNPVVGRFRIENVNFFHVNGQTHLLVTFGLRPRIDPGHQTVFAADYIELYLRAQGFYDFDDGFEGIGDGGVVRKCGILDVFGPDSENHLPVNFALEIRLFLGGNQKLKAVGVDIEVGVPGNDFLASMKFIPGLPMNPPTNLLTG